MTTLVELEERKGTCSDVPSQTLTFLKKDDDDDDDDEELTITLSCKTRLMSGCGSMAT